MFKIGAIYNRRSDIHKNFGGNIQSGIANSPKHPFIFLFSAIKGEEYGYKDGWISETDYVYSGEGQTGNQEFKRGNRAIRDHVANGKQLHLFERHGLGTYKYVGEFALVSHEFVNAKDFNDNSRQLIKFLLRKKSA